MKSLSILVVDDDRDHADSMAELFAIEGHDVTVAYSGGEAIEAYRERKFDLGFMDVVMPGMNGVQSFLEIRKQTPGARICMVSGYSVEDLLRQAAVGGAFGILRKPIDPAKLIEAITFVRPSGLVVVAENSPDFGSSLRDLAVAGALNCELASSSSDAVTRLDRPDPDVLILDLDVPLIDRISIYSSLREQGRSIPTILITDCLGGPDAVSRDLSQVRQSGILLKPFDPAALIDNLDRLMA